MLELVRLLSGVMLLVGCVTDGRWKGSCQGSGDEEREVEVESTRRF